MKALDLFCGAGGATKGLQMAGYEVTGVDINPQPHYIGDHFYQADALTFSLEGYDLIWASPPCQAYSTTANTWPENREKYLKAIPQVRERLRKYGGPYIIENVVGAPLENWVQLCGSMFGLPVIRHRRFESNYLLLVGPHRCHTVRCSKRRDTHRGIYSVYGHEVGTAEEWAAALGITWKVTKHEAAEAIPPIYSQYLAEQISTERGLE